MLMFISAPAGGMDIHFRNYTIDGILLLFNQLYFV